MGNMMNVVIVDSRDECRFRHQVITMFRTGKNIHVDKSANVLEAVVMENSNAKIFKIPNITAVLHRIDPVICIKEAIKHKNDSINVLKTVIEVFPVREDWAQKIAACAVKYYDNPLLIYMIGELKIRNLGKCAANAIKFGNLDALPLMFNCDADWFSAACLAAHLGFNDIVESYLAVFKSGYEHDVVSAICCGEYDLRICGLFDDVRLMHLYSEDAELEGAIERVIRANKPIMLKALLGRLTEDKISLRMSVVKACKYKLMAAYIERFPGSKEFITRQMCLHAYKDDWRKTVIYLKLLT